MDKIVDKIVALGIPGLVLLVAMGATGWVGAAAVTTALAALGGPLGMIGGIGVLIVLSMISKGLTQYSFEKLFKATVRKLYEKGISKKEIRDKIKHYPISKGLRKKINEYLDNLETKGKKESS